MALSTLMLLCLPVLLVLSGFFSGSETALFSLTRHQRAQLKTSGTLAGTVITTLLAETRGLLITLLMGNMTVNVLYFVVSTKLLLIAQQEHWLSPVALGVVSVAPLLVIIILGEVLPKLVAARAAVVCSRLAAVPLLTVHRLISPIRWFASIFIITPLARLIAPRNKPESLSADELASLLELSQRQGVIDPQEQRILRQALDLGRVKIDELMTPRVDLHAFDMDSDPNELIEFFKRTNLRQAPAYRKSLDNIEGFISARRVLLYPPGSRLELNSLIEPATFVPQQQRADQLLAQLRRDGKTIAVVVDEYGGTAGLVTLEDVAEHLVGDIAGAFDDGSQPMVEKTAEGVWRVSAELSTRDWAEAFGQRVPADVHKTLGAVHTLGGLVMAGLGRAAQTGDEITIGNLVLSVDSLDGRRIEYVTVRLVETEKPAARKRKGAAHE
ncbi:MAG: hemolysin family protein [Phycisphaerales bacterium]